MRLLSSGMTRGRPQAYCTPFQLLAHLDISAWIPIRVKKQHPVSPREVDAKSTNLRSTAIQPTVQGARRKCREEKEGEEPEGSTYLAASCSFSVKRMIWREAKSLCFTVRKSSTHLASSLLEKWVHHGTQLRGMMNLEYCFKLGLPYNALAFSHPKALQCTGFKSSQSLTMHWL